MSGLNFQKVLFSLYTEKSIREDFLASPQTFLAKHNLDEREKRALLELPIEPLQSFAQSLTNKKIRILKKSAASYDIVAVSSSYLDGPVIFFKSAGTGAVKNIKINRQAFLLLDQLRALYLDLPALFKVYLASENVSALDFFKIALLINKEGLWHHKIKII